MATASINKVLQHLHDALRVQDAANLSDGQLLDRVVGSRDDVALETLVRRHAAMVWGVCRRVLPNHHDAEDAFQATFLVLVRKAAAVKPREMLVNWLHGVAHQTARKARAMAAKRHSREQTRDIVPEPIVAEAGRTSDLHHLLDEELGRLPEKYRIVIVLCDLEGQTRTEAAGQLGCPEGTIAGRLARARTMLADRLARRGLAVSGTALAALLAQQAAAAPGELLAGTIQAVTGQAAGLVSANAGLLAQAVLKTMLLTKLTKAAVLMLVLALFTFAAASLSYHPAIGQSQPTTLQADDTKKNPDAPKPDSKPAAKERAQLAGTWKVVAMEIEGKRFDEKEIDPQIRAKINWLADAEGRKRPGAFLKPWLAIFLSFDSDGKWTQHVEGDATFTYMNCEGSSVLDAAQTPRTIDFTVTRSNNLHRVKNEREEKGQVKRLVYEVVDDTCRICFAATSKDRPKEIAADVNSGNVVWTLQRVRKAPDEQLLGGWHVISQHGDAGAPDWLAKMERIAFGSPARFRDVELPSSAVIESRTGKVATVAYAALPEASPPIMRFTIARGEKDEATLQGSYRIDGEFLQICMNHKPNVVAPGAFDLKRFPNCTNLVLKRDQDDKISKEPRVRSAKDAAKLLKQFNEEPDNFDITIGRHGIGDPRVDLRTITLHVGNRRYEPSAIGPSGKPIFKNARITKEQALKIIETLDTWATYFRTATEVDLPEPDNEACILTRLHCGPDAKTTAKLSLKQPWSWKMIGQLTAVRECVDGRAALIVGEFLDAALSQPPPPKVGKARDKLRVLLVNGRPAKNRFETATEHLRLALNPFGDKAPDTHKIRPEVMSPAQFGAMAAFDAWDCIFLCDVPRLTAHDAHMLEIFVRLGGGVVVCLGPQVDMEAYNKVLHRDGKGLLPVRLLEQRAAKPDHDFRFAIAEEAFKEPPLAAFTDEPDRQTLLQARFRKFIKVEEPTPASKARIIASFEEPPNVKDGKPSRAGIALLTSRPFADANARSGRVVLVTTTVNMDWTSFPGSPAYGALCHELVHFVGPAPKAEKKQAKAEFDLQGVWQTISSTRNGKERVEEAGSLLEFVNPERIIVHLPKSDENLGFVWKPGVITLRHPLILPIEPEVILNETVTALGGHNSIYRIDGDTLTICCGTADRKPTEFSDKDQVLWVLQRKPAAKVEVFEALRGPWQTIRSTSNGKDRKEEKDVELAFASKDTIIVRAPRRQDTAVLYRWQPGRITTAAGDVMDLDPPKVLYQSDTALDLRNCIYKIDGDTLTIVAAKDRLARDFTDKDQVLWVLQRKPPAKAKDAKLALSAEVAAWQGKPYLKVFLANTSDRPLEVKMDSDLVDRLCTATLDGRDTAMITERADLGAATLTTLKPKAKVQLGVITFHPDVNAHFKDSPLLYIEGNGKVAFVEPGKHAIEIHARPGRFAIVGEVRYDDSGIPGAAVAPAVVDVTLPKKAS